jgi:CAAX prenyl protease-like protein
MNPANRPEREVSLWARAHVLPFGVFMGFQLLLQFAGIWLTWKHPDAPWWRQAPEQWIYPMQAIVVFALLVRNWKYYEFGGSWKRISLGVFFGVVGIGLWLLPTTLYDRMGLTSDPDGWMGWLGIAARRDGFDPGIFESPVAWWSAVILRFFRAMIVVALMEEIFWRGFLMRFVNDWEGKWWNQPFGKATWRSYLVVTGLFVLAHLGADWAAAIVYGSLTYLLCVKTKSLTACIVMHATANFLMCLYAMAYGKYGLW